MAFFFLGIFLNQIQELDYIVMLFVIIVRLRFSVLDCFTQTVRLKNLLA